MDAVQDAVGPDAPEELGMIGLAEEAMRTQSSCGSSGNPERTKIAAAVAVVSKFDGVM